MSLYVALLFSAGLYVELSDRNLLDDIYAFHKEVLAIGHSERRNSIIGEEFDRFLSYHVENIEKLQSRELFQLRIAINSAFYNTLLQEYALIYESTLYYHSGAPPVQAVKNTIQKFWIVRDLDKMSSVAERFNLNNFLSKNYHLPDSFFSYQEYSTITVEEDEIKLVDRRHLLNDEYKLVVVSDIGCGFSQKLYRSYENAVQSGIDLSGNITWLIPQHSAVTPSHLKNLKEEYPSINFEVVYSNADWASHVSFDQTPLVYSVTDGKFSLEIVGWAEENEAEDLVNLLSE